MAFGWILISEKLMDVKQFFGKKIIPPPPLPKKNTIPSIHRLFRRPHPPSILHLFPLTGVKTFRWPRIPLWLLEQNHAALTTKQAIAGRGAVALQKNGADVNNPFKKGRINNFTSGYRNNSI